MTQTRFLTILLVVGLVSVSVAAQSAPPKKNIPAIAKAAKGAIITIVMANNDEPISWGSGFLVSPDGMVVTNYHVIETGNVAIVKFPDGIVLPVDGVLAADKARDLAIIKIHGKNFRALTLGNSDRIQIGEDVVAIGNPLGLELTVSNGILSGVRNVEKEGGKFLQITAPISHGSSGGPLFNMAGEVVGITSMYFEGGENLNFAIPVNDAKLLLQERTAELRNLPNETKTEKALKDSNAEATPSQKQACNDRSAKFVRYKAARFPEPQIELTSHYDPKSGICYVESGFYYEKSYDASFIEIENAFSEGTTGPLYGKLDLRPDVFVAGGKCHIYPRNTPEISCRSKEEFDELAQKYFGIDRQLPGWPRARTLGTTPPNRPTAEIPKESHSVPPNTKIAANLPAPELASEAQIFDDTRYCYLNPNNKLQAPDGSLIACKELIAAIDVRLAQCKTGPESKTKECKSLLRRFKDFQAGRL